MSYAPIYSKLHELEQRLAVVEASKAVATTAPVAPVATTAPVAAIASTDFDISGIRKEIDDLAKVVSTLATKDELPDVSAFATIASLDALATKSELPDVSGFATLASLDAFATIASLDAFATKSELPDVSGFATLASLDAFATKEELVAYAELSAKFDNLLNVVSHLNTKITEANEKIAELEARP
jgi:hypothetical protein